MPQSMRPNRIKMGDSLTYRICVEGYLEDVWSDRLADMTIKANIENANYPKTELVGRLRDQSQLLGVLNSF